MAALLLLGACAGPPHSGYQGPSMTVGSREGSTVNARLSLFLNLKDARGKALQMTIEAIEILDAQGRWLPLLEQPLAIDSGQIPGGQIFLGRAPIAIGYYNKIRIRTASTPLASVPWTSETKLDIHRPLFVAQGDSHSIFLGWDVAASLGGPKKDGPVLSILPRLKKLLVGVAYVACPAIDTVYMICTDKNWVCDSLGVKGGPGYLSLDPISPRASLYALSENQKGIKRLGPASNRVEADYPLTMLGPGLHFAIGPDGTWAYVIDSRRGNIFKVNLHSGAVVQRRRLGFGPSYILYLKRQGLLAVTLGQSQSVVLLDPLSLNQVQTISTASKPEGLLLVKDHLLYIAESGANTVQIYDLERNQSPKRISVGLSPRRLLLSKGHIYVTNKDSQSLSLLNPGQLGVAKTISLDGAPLELAYSRQDNWLYVGNARLQGLDIIDPLSNKVQGRISLGATPKGLVVLQ